MMSLTLFHNYVVLHPATSLVWLGLFSLLVGSFLNVVIYRLPLMIQTEWKTECCELLQQPISNPLTPSLNLCFPRSHCPACQRLIPAWHNIPLISYVLLRGRCHACTQRISWHYPFVELLCLGLSLFAGYYLGFSLQLLFVLLFIWLLICLSFIDLTHQILPDGLTLGLLWLGLIANTATLFTPLPNAVLAAASAYLGLWLFIKLFYLCTKKVGMGHGDFKLFAAFGAWFGGSALLPILTTASILATLVGLVYLGIQRKGRDTPIPFGPFLCIAGCGHLFFTVLK